MRRDAELDEHHGGLAALRVDGGAAANDLLMQLQADLLQVGVFEKPEPREGLGQQRQQCILRSEATYRN